MSLQIFLPAQFAILLEVFWQNTRSLLRGESTFSKTCSYRTARSLKRDFNTSVFLWVWKQLFYRTPVKSTWESILHYKVAVPKNFKNRQKKVNSFILSFRVRSPAILLIKYVNFMKFSRKIFSQNFSQSTISFISNTG